MRLSPSRPSWKRLALRSRLSKLTLTSLNNAKEMPEPQGSGIFSCVTASALAFSRSLWYTILAKNRRCGETGRRSRLKICRWKHRTGSIPVTGTKKHSTPAGRCAFFVPARERTGGETDARRRRFEANRRPRRLLGREARSPAPKSTTSQRECRAFPFLSFFLTSRW